MSGREKEKKEDKKKGEKRSRESIRSAKKLASMLSNPSITTVRKSQATTETPSTKPSRPKPHIFLYPQKASAAKTLVHHTIITQPPHNHHSHHKATSQLASVEAAIYIEFLFFIKIFLKCSVPLRNTPSYCSGT